MPTNSPKPPTKSTHPSKSPKFPPTKSPKLINPSSSSSSLRQRGKSLDSSAAQQLNNFKQPPPPKQPQAPQQSKQSKRKKKKKSCYSSCCCALFLAWLAVIFVFILQESWDPDGELAVKILEAEVLQDIAGPSVELPGAKMAKAGVKSHFPAVFIPGIISTGLEVWQGTPCAQKHFRQRFWGTGLMLRKILLAKQCWLQHIMLTPEWTDPPGIKLRPAQGLVAADYLVADYWVWAKVIENLAFLGYDESNMHMASYDWRLPFKMLETRDRYFTRLKANIELLRITNDNTKVVLIAHSMGANVLVYFFRWVESNFGSLWVEKNVEAFVNIGGPLLGVSKTISSLLSGEMRDTAELSPTLQFIKENFLSKEDLMHLFRSFGSLPSMMPKGIWPGPILRMRENELPIECRNNTLHHHNETSTTKSATSSANTTTTNSTGNGNHTTANTTASAANSTSNNTSASKPKNKTSKTNKNSGSTTPASTVSQHDTTFEAINKQDLVDGDKGDKGDTGKTGTTSKKDTNEEAEATKAKEIEMNESTQEIHTDIPLPPYVNFTVSMAIELLRNISPAYMELLEQYYDLGFDGSKIESHDERQWVNPLKAPLPAAPMKVYCMYGVGKPTEYSYYYRGSPASTLLVEIDTSVIEEDVFHGVVVGEGDGTVPLMSLGYMCVKGWQDKQLNPSGVPVVTREYQHSVLSLFEGARAGLDGLRGGYGTADHVDIMGNHHMLEDIAKILTNTHTDEVQNQFYSNIVHLANEVKFESVKDVK